MIPPPIMTTSAVCAMLSTPPCASLSHAALYHIYIIRTRVVKEISHPADRKATVSPITAPRAQWSTVPHGSGTRELLYMSLPDRQHESDPGMRRAKIRTLLQNYEEIPTVPSMVETITALTADVTCSLAALEATIKTDQSSVAR